MPLSAGETSLDDVVGPCDYSRCSSTASTATSREVLSLRLPLRKGVPVRWPNQLMRRASFVRLVVLRVAARCDERVGMPEPGSPPYLFGV